MDSKEKFEKPVTPKRGIKKEEAVSPDYKEIQAVSPDSGISRKSIDESSLKPPIESSNTVIDSRADSTPVKSMETKEIIGEIFVSKSVVISKKTDSGMKKNVDDIADNASVPMESTPPLGGNQNERCSLIEGIKSLKKMKDIEGNTSSMELTPPVNTTIYHRNETEQSLNTRPKAVVPREAVSILRALPNFDEPPLVLATHLVPSLPIFLFEILAEILETITGRPVVLLHESRSERPVAKNIVDIAILPAGGDWDEGSLLPVSFVFEHRLKTTKNPDVYVDVVVAMDCVRNIEGILDLRGYRCALPDRMKVLGAAALLFRHLNSKGESPSFFGDTFDSGSQLSTLQMVAGKQTEIGVLESPVFLCHKNTLHGIDSVCVLESLGPLPPYRIMLNKKTQAPIREKIIKGLLSVACDDIWMGKLGKFGVSGFAEYNVDRYDLEDLKFVAKSVPYY